MWLLDSIALNPPYVLIVCPYLSLKVDTSSHQGLIQG